MKRRTAFVAAIAFCTVCSAAYAAYKVSNDGRWPESWPKELEPLRSRRTLTRGGTMYHGPVQTMSFLSPTKRTLRLPGRIS